MGLTLSLNLEADFETDLNSYLESLEYSKVRSLADIIQFNKENADHELPEGIGSCGLLSRRSSLCCVWPCRVR
jgi:hypothetical protein